MLKLFIFDLLINKLSTKRQMILIYVGEVSKPVNLINERAHTPKKITNKARNQSCVVLCDWKTFKRFSNWLDSLPALLYPHNCLVSSRNISLSINKWYDYEELSRFKTRAYRKMRNAKKNDYYQEQSWDKMCDCHSMMQHIHVRR